jgi:predicted metalloprotease with PDZ domain
VPWGLRCTETPAGLKINRVQRDSVAAKAGLSAHDVIIAIDGIKADNKQLASLSNAERDVDCYFFRRDELMCVSVRPKVAIDAQDHNIAGSDASTEAVFPHKVSLHLSKSVASSEGDADQVQASWQSWLNGIERYQV